jgi:HSP20 family protein
MIPISKRKVIGPWSDTFDYPTLAFNRMREPWYGPVSPEDFQLGEYPMDIDEDDKNVYVEAELPGFKKDEIILHLEGNELRIRAERKPSRSRGTRHLYERFYSRVNRWVTLPAPVDPDAVDAKLEDGVLRLTMQKTDQPEKSRIKIT